MINVITLINNLKKVINITILDNFFPLPFYWLHYVFKYPNSTLMQWNDWFLKTNCYNRMMLNEQMKDILKSPCQCTTHPLLSHSKQKEQEQEQQEQQQHYVLSPYQQQQSPASSVEAHHQQWISEPVYEELPSGRPLHSLFNLHFSVYESWDSHGGLCLPSSCLGKLSLDAESRRLIFPTRQMLTTVQLVRPARYKSWFISIVSSPIIRDHQLNNFEKLYYSCIDQFVVLISFERYQVTWKSLIFNLIFIISISFYPFKTSIIHSLNNS